MQICNFLPILTQTKANHYGEDNYYTYYKLLLSALAPTNKQVWICFNPLPAIMNKMSYEIIETTVCALLEALQGGGGGGTTILRNSRKGGGGVAAIGASSHLWCHAFIATDCWWNAKANFPTSPSSHLPPTATPVLQSVNELRWSRKSSEDVQKPNWNTEG